MGFGSRCLVIGSAALLSGLLSIPRAHANGRYPQAMQLSEDPSDPNRLWLRTTYGMLTSADRGGHWAWICEEAMGFSSTKPFDPTYAVMANGTLILGTIQNGIMRARNKGCSWDSAVTALQEKFVLDLAVDATAKSRAIGLVSLLASGATTPNYTNEIWQTTDNGESFALLTNAFDPHMFSTTLDTAPSDPNRIYVSGHFYDSGNLRDVPVPALVRSKDRGQHWERMGWNGLAAPPESGTVIFIAAVHPTNPDILYVRTLHHNADLTDTSLVLYTEDGGSTWKQVLSGPAPMLGFALSPDGSEVAVGFGDPGDEATRQIDPSALGLWRARAPEFKFDRVFEDSISCLTWTGRGLYACSRVVPAGFDVALMNEYCPSFEPLQRRDKVAGPLACPKGSTVNTLCTPTAWSQNCEYNQLGCADGGSSALAGATQCDGPVDAGSPGKPRAEENDDGGCRIAGIPGKPRNSTSNFVASLVALLLVRRARGSKRCA